MLIHVKYVQHSNAQEFHGNLLNSENSYLKKIKDLFKALISTKSISGLEMCDIWALPIEKLTKS